MLVNNGRIFCPLCEDWFQGSEYLRGVFAEDKTYWLSVIVCHYRHSHVDYYNRWVGYHARYRNYDTFKQEVNNKAKRQLIRKCMRFLIENDITAKDFAALNHTDQETLDLAYKKLGGEYITLEKPKTEIINLDRWCE